jgi:hypothetical protein
MIDTKNKQPVLWCSRRLNSGFAWLTAIAVVLGSIRGMLVIHAGIEPSVVYLTSAVFLFLLAALGFFISSAFHFEGKSLKTLMSINLAFGTLYVSIDWMLTRTFDPGTLYLYLAPFIVFQFVSMPVHYFRIAIVLVTLAISLSVIDNFVETLTNPNGYEAIVEFNMTLRPDNYQSTTLSRTDNFYRVGGYTGNYHDSGNILGMVVVYFLTNFILYRKTVDFGMFLLAASGMTLTQSAANIIIAICTVCIFLAYLEVQSKKSLFVYFLCPLIAVAGLDLYLEGFMQIFLKRLGPDGDWDGMLSQLNFESILPFILSAWTGHVSGFSTEVAIVNLIFELGLGPVLILYAVMCYPLYLYRKINPPCFDAIPALAAVFFGFASLLHYGSIFRVTSVFLFYLFYALSIIIMMNYNYHQISTMNLLSRTGGVR